MAGMAAQTGVTGGNGTQPFTGGDAALLAGRDRVMTGYFNESVKTGCFLADRPKVHSDAQTKPYVRSAVT